MNARLAALAAALAACATPVWAVTSNVDIPGVIVMPPSSGVIAVAADIGPGFYSPTPFVPTASVTETPGQTAAIALADYAAQAKTTLGGNHAYAQASGFGNGALGVTGFSGWYDQLTLTGGTGTGTILLSVQLNGVVDAGAFAGGAAYGLFASTVHPTQLVDALNIVDAVVSPGLPWALSAPLGNGQTPALTTIAHYAVGVSPYHDTEILFPAQPASGPGIPSIENPSMLLGGAPLEPVRPDLILTPGANQAVNVTLTGTLTFTYGEAFYLIGALGTSMFDGLGAFCTFDIGGTCTLPALDGSGATTLDFFNSAHLTTVVLPQGASLSSASGVAYNVTTVPEPGAWLLLLAGLGVLGWRVRRRA
ncbi:MAG: PEP-CTERM sorting domain-containing protein [Thiobacillus sp.]|nr:PEP-CTERM sorting domain-containing protein [Thiobacillus sp.]